MTVVWIVVAIMVLCLAVVFFGAAMKYMLQWVVTIALVVVTPIKETIHLYKSKQKFISPRSELEKWHRAHRSFCQMKTEAVRIFMTLPDKRSGKCELSINE